jgi:hypothetical protein
VKMWQRTLCLAGLSAFVLFGKDAVQASVDPSASAKQPIVTMNGNPYSPGTYAIGTIQLFYDIQAYQFPSGELASFRLDLRNVHTSDGQDPSYPVSLQLVQIGSSNVVLTPAASFFIVPGLGWTASTSVAVTIPASVSQNPALNADGTELVANLQIRTVPAGAKLDTPTTVQVHIRLVHPTACLKLYDFLTNQDLTASVSSLVVSSYKNGAKAGLTKSTSVPQLSNNVMVVSTCSAAQTFDLALTVDSSFKSPNGNSVFTFTKAGYTDPSAFAIGDFGLGTPAGASRCFHNVALAAGQTFLVTVHIGIDEIPTWQLPASGAFAFQAAAFTAGSGCPGSLNSLASPNPVNLNIPFTVSP